MRLLGDSSFAVRQRAGKELAAAGISAEAPLVAALESPDAEVRTRAAHLLAIVRAADFRSRLDAFASDLAGKQDYHLAGWDQFRSLMGDGRASRALFVEMQRAEPALLEALDQNGKAATSVFSYRFQSILQGLQFGHFVLSTEPRAATSRGSIAALLFVGATGGVSVDEQTVVQLYPLISQPAFQNGVKSGPLAPYLKKLLGRWMLKNNAPPVAFQNLMLAFTLDLKEGLDLAVKMLEGSSSVTAPYALLVIAKFGTHSHVPLVEKYFADRTVCESRRVGGRQVETQVRDVALAVAVHLTGQSLREYGFGRVELSRQVLLQPSALAFVHPSSRQAAMRKWEQWTSQQKDK